MDGAPRCTFTRFDRLWSGLSRLTYGMATWRGFDARRLAAERSATGRTTVVVGCRFPPGFQGPGVSHHWNEVRVFVGDERLEFLSGRRRKPAALEVAPGRARLRMEHDGPPPSFETTITVAAGRTVLVEVRPEAVHLLPWLCRAPQVSVWDGDDHLQARHDL